MNFENANILLEAIKPYTENATITISTENRDWKGRVYNSDFVTIDEKNDVSFEVLDNEIIVFYFTDHVHFEDYSSELDDGDDDYVKRAIKFLIELFENQIKYIAIYKGKKIATEKYYMIYPDGRETRINYIMHSFANFLNPFAKRTEKTTIYKFDKVKGCFEQK